MYTGSRSIVGAPLTEAAAARRTADGTTRRRSRTRRWLEGCAGEGAQAEGGAVAARKKHRDRGMAGSTANLPLRCSSRAQAVSILRGPCPMEPHSGVTRHPAGSASCLVHAFPWSTVLSLHHFPPARPPAATPSSGVPFRSFKILGGFRKPEDLARNWRETGEKLARNWRAAGEQPT